MTVDPLKALLRPLQTDDAIPGHDASILFCHGLYDPAVKALSENLDVYQPFYPAAQKWRHEDIGLFKEMPNNTYDMIMMLTPQQINAMRGLLAEAAERLDDKGLIIVAAANDAGGKRLPAEMKALFGDIQQDGKYKSRVVWAYKTKNYNEEIAKNWMREAALQPVCEGRYVSRPGIFGWNTVDTGSSLLAQSIDTPFKGGGADFGCGYGYLADYVCRHHENISDIYCLDADVRALEACRVNLEKSCKDVKTHMLWTDLTVMQPNLPLLDWIVMNPPFHMGKKTDTAIGEAFIKSAAASLKEGGALWMVANAHLPYEKVLAKTFQSLRNVTEEKGFKVFHATR